MKVSNDTYSRRKKIHFSIRNSPGVIKLIEVFTEDGFLFVLVEESISSLQLVVLREGACKQLGDRGVVAEEEARHLLRFLFFEREVLLLFRFTILFARGCDF